MVLFFSTVDIPDHFQIQVAQFQPTERPIEDRFSVDFDLEQSRLIIGVYDGHGGAEAADYISRALPSRLLKHSPSEHSRQFRQLDDSILLEFQRNHSLFRKRSPDWIDNARVVKSGSAALILDIDLECLFAVYANAGDSRMIVCDLDAEGGHKVLLETTDLNAKTPLERARLVKEHPGEDEVIIGNRLFGKMMCTRGFGDGYYKFPMGFFGIMHKKYVDVLSSVEQPGKIPMNEQYASYFYAYKTPPYITASPESGSLQLEKGHIIISASDGLWDLISSEAAALIVTEAVAEHRHDLARYLLEKVQKIKPPADDVTIIAFEI